MTNSAVAKIAVKTVRICLLLIYLLCRLGDDAFTQLSDHRAL